MGSRQVFKTALRRAAIASFARLNPGDVTIHHQWCDTKVRVHSFRHKGYWTRGRTRERDTMVAFAALTGPGDTVVEVGAHIGYVTQYLAHLVGPTGRVVAFEPGGNNLPYLRANTGHLTNVSVVEAACGAGPGKRRFYLEDLTGQNNSFLPNYELLRQAEAKAVRANVSEVVVEVLPLDGFVSAHGVSPDVLKIDVEGAEHEVLLGAQGFLESGKPIVMAELTHEVEHAFDLLTALGYVGFDAGGEVLDDPRAVHINTFWLHPAAHSAQIAHWARK